MNQQTVEAFEAAILAKPDDDAPRLIFADWLEEQGDFEYEELMRNPRAASWASIYKDILNRKGTEDEKEFLVTGMEKHYKSMRAYFKLSEKLDDASSLLSHRPAIRFDRGGTMFKFSQVPAIRFGFAGRTA